MEFMATISIEKKGSFIGDDIEEKEVDPTGITRIVKVSIDHGDYIHGLTVYFECNGTTQCTGRWGGKIYKVDTTEIDLKTNEYITSVNGYMKPDYDGICYVRSLVLKTNLNVYGRYGMEEGEYFEFPALGGQIIGFHAHYTERAINALGVYVRQSNSTIIKKGPFLGRGGIVKHMDPTGITRIVKISIYHSDKIDALIVYFERNGIMQCTDRWGGDGGKLTEINLKTNEYIWSVRGFWDYSSHILKSLVLETNLDIYGPCGKEEGQFFEHTSLHGRIIGFFACVGINYVLGVGVYVLPVLQVPEIIISKSMPCGGSGGTTRDMHPTLAISHITKVSIRHSDTIDALSICYTLEDGTTEGTSLWGGETGELTEINIYDHIKAVRGYVGYFGNISIVRSLQLITNYHSYGPYGKEEGTPFELSSFDGEIIGFHGRSGAYLHAIGVYVKWPKNRIRFNMA